jgi:transposase
MRYWGERENVDSQEGPMSLQPQAIPPVPEETARIARAMLPKGNTSIHMRDELGTFFRDEDFLDLFSEKGQPAESAWRLALVMVMHYARSVNRCRQDAH